MPVNKNSTIWLVKLVSDMEQNREENDTTITVTTSQEDQQSVSSRTTKAKKDKKKNKKRLTEVETPDSAKRVTTAANSLTVEPELSRTGSKVLVHVLSVPFYLK